MGEGAATNAATRQRPRVATAQRASVDLPRPVDSTTLASFFSQLPPTAADRKPSRPEPSRPAPRTTWQVLSPTEPRLVRSSPGAPLFNRCYIQLTVRGSHTDWSTSLAWRLPRA